MPDVIGVNDSPELSARQLAPYEDKLVGVTVNAWTVGLSSIINGYVERYGLPILVSETAVEGDDAHRVSWLDAVVGLIHSLRAEGVAVVISTAYLDEAERCDRLALLNRGAMIHCDTPAALKARMPGAMLEIATAEARRLRELLLGRPGIHSVLLIGTGAHVHVDDAVLRQGESGAALEAAGIAVSRIGEVTPSIEDLFVALLENAALPS